MHLEGKVAIVTGAGGSGCGRAIARRFSARGASVVASDINENGLRETLAEIEAAGARASAFKANVRVEREIRALVAYAEEKFGGLDVMVNNASGPDYRPDEPLEYWTDIIETDLLGSM